MNNCPFCASPEWPPSEVSDHQFQCGTYQSDRWHTTAACEYAATLFARAKAAEEQVILLKVEVNHNWQATEDLEKALAKIKRLEEAADFMKVLMPIDCAERMLAVENYTKAKSAQ